MFKCDICSSTFNLKHHLDRHVHAKHNGVTLSCDMCEFSTNRKDSLKRHKIVHTKRKIEEGDTRPPKKRCNWDASISNQELIETLESAQYGQGVHLKNVEPEPEKRLGGQNSDGNANEWDDDITAEDFDEAASAQNIEPEPEKNRCSICDARFNLKAVLGRHIKTVHTDIKPWACTECDKSFSRKDKLESHIVTHRVKKRTPTPKKTEGRVNSDFDGGAELKDDNGVQSAMRGMFTNKTWLIRKAKDPRLLLTKYHNILKRWLQMLLLKTPLKFYITMKITMVKISKDGVKHRATAGFY